MSADERPIGIFDSGIGGLTVLRELRREIPNENLVYFGDTARVPYGTKSKETITRFSIDNVTFLQGFQTKLIVVACNTASSLALDTLRNEFNLPIIGVIEPGAREALARTKNGRIGVIGTKATIGSGAYEACLKKLDPKLKVFSEACPLFVPFVEEGWLDGDIVEKVARTYLNGMKSFGVDTLILGCTHYPLLNGVIQATIGENVHLVNSAKETAKEARLLLKRSEILSKRKKEEQETQFFVSDEPEPFRALGERFLGKSIATVAKIGDYAAAQS